MKALKVNKYVKEVIVMVTLGVLFNVMFFKVTPVTLLITVVIWVALSRGNAFLVELINKYISWLERPVLRLAVGVLVMISYTILAMTVIIVGANVLIKGTNPLDILRRIGMDDFIIGLLITLIITMFLHGRAFYLEWKNALLREEKLKNESLKSQYESLKNQVNPHFLFNSLNVLSGLVYEDQKKAVEFIRKMSNVYRYVLDKKDLELVPLEDELNFMTSYAYLQQIRFGDNFRIQVDRDGDGYLPPLALQLLVENAIKHNIVSEAKPLNVDVVIRAHEIRVKNNIQEKLSKDSTGIGLNNLIARYDYLSDRKMEIHNDGKTFEVVLPLLTLNQ